VVFAPCTDGLRQVRVGPDGSLQPGWRAPSQVTGSPVVAGGVVWALDPKRGRLYALDENTGKPRGEWAVGRASRFASPTPAGQLMLIPTMTGITALTGA
jgi:outer membrane protein assembly factor BamB